MRIKDANKVLDELYDRLNNLREDIAGKGNYYCMDPTKYVCYDMINKIINWLETQEEPLTEE